MNDNVYYNGYEGTVEYNAATDGFRGKIVGIDDLVTYEAEALYLLEGAFIEAVDDYIATRAEISGAKP